VTIQYNAAGAYVLYDENRSPLQPTAWDHALGTWGKVQRRYCGEFRYEGVKNRLQFYIENSHAKGCVLYVMPRDAIMLGIRLEFTLE